MPKGAKVMNDPVARMVNFIAAEHGRVAHEHACQTWLGRVPHLLSRVQQVVEVFLHALEQPGWTVNVRTDLARSEFPLAITFDPPEPSRGRHLPSQEIGASAHFRCASDGIVYGFRFPFHAMKGGVRPERFADLGAPEAVGADHLAHAVADFLEWAAVGKGCGRRQLHFATAPRQASVEAEPVALRIAA
jgi:hypothetical protein